MPVVSPLIPAALTCLGWLSGGEGGSRELEAVPEGFSGQPGSERWGLAVLPSLRPQPRAPGAPAVHAGCPGAHTGLPADSQGCRSRAVWPRAAQGVGVGDTKPPGPGLGGLSGGGGRGLGWHSGGRGRPSGARGLGLSHAEVCVGRARAAGDTWLQPHCFKLAKPTAPSPRSRIESDSKHRKLSGRKNSPLPAAQSHLPEPTPCSPRAWGGVIIPGVLGHQAASEPRPCHQAAAEPNRTGVVLPAGAVLGSPMSGWDLPVGLQGPLGVREDRAARRGCTPRGCPWGPSSVSRTGHGLLMGGAFSTLRSCAKETARVGWGASGAEAPSPFAFSEWGAAAPPLHARPCPPCSLTHFLLGVLSL